MAATVARVFRNKILGNRRIAGCVGGNTSQTSLFSAQTQPITCDEPSGSLLEPLKHPDYFQVHKLFTVKDLFDARVHYGHVTGLLEDKMAPFVYGTRMGHVIFDLDKTAYHLREALNFTAHIAYKSGIILFVMKSPQFTHIVEKTAIECGEYSHTRKWRVGTFTNSVKEFQAVTRLPDLCIFLCTLNDVMMEHPAVAHSAKMGIPTVGIVDSNCNPNLITYPVPGNDDTLSAIELYCKLFKEAILLGKQARDNDQTQT